MKKTKILLSLLLIIGSIGGTYFWQWYTLHHTKAIVEPINSTITTSEEKNQPEKTNSRLNLLVLGTDNRSQEIARSDLIMFVTANVDTRQVAMISIPRDTRVNVPKVGLTKINHANAVGQARGGIHEGTLESVKVVSDLLGVPIHYYIKIDFEGFKEAVDMVGGINVDLPSPVDDDLRKIHLSSGQHHLSGDQALRLSRARYGLPKGDFDRQFNQFNLLSALAYQMLSPENIPKLPEVVNMVYKDFIDANVSPAKMIAMGLNFKGITKEQIKYYQLPGKGISAEDPLVGAAVYYYEPDLDGVEKVVKLAIVDEQ